MNPLRFAHELRIIPRMNKSSCLTLLLAAVSLIASAHARQDQLTPLLASPLVDNTRPVTGTDGKVHFVYELVLTNANITPATPKKIEVLAADQATVLASFQEKELLLRLRNTGNGPVDNPTIEYNGTRLFLIDFTLDASQPVPPKLWHRVETLAAPSPSPKPQTPALLTYTVAPVDVLQKLPMIGPPLLGKGWLAVNGCCAPGGVHRATGLPVNGKIYFAQRFAIDWMRMDDDGRLVHGDPSEVRNYIDYGADVIAVADGTVVETLNDLDDQKPGELPAPSTITLQNVDGNHIVLDLGNGVFAFYAHLKKGSAKVKPGDRVKRGQILAQLGNTGNTSAPHLHFHLMEGTSVLGSNGIPYLIDSFELAGQASDEQFQAATSLVGNWGAGRLPVPNPRNRQFPLDLNIVDFSAGK
jgi:hypothetical protein